MDATTDLMLFALLLALVAIFFSVSGGGFASEGGIYILLGLVVGLIAVAGSVVRDLRGE